MDELGPISFPSEMLTNFGPDTRARKLAILQGLVDWNIYTGADEAKYERLFVIAVARRHRDRLADSLG